MKKSQKIIVVNPDAGLAPGLRDRFSVHVDGFQVSRVLSLCSKGEDALPKFLESLTSDEATVAPKKARVKKRSATRKR